ncbi:MAG TPA: hypothetical protein VIJ77_06915 [Candidatus Tumulicola sp.]|jgi:hypothetical protein
MLRYFVIATVVVVGIAMAIAAWTNRDLIRIKIASVYASAPPKPEPSTGIGTGTRAGMRGDAPWALSALPECLIQTSKTTGPRDYVLAHLPPDAVAVAPPATLKFGDCTISVAGAEAYVRRGADRFRIPPPARFYRTPRGVALLRGNAAGGNELRVYEPGPERANEHE